MAHETVYAICENKCREETLTKEQIIKLINEGDNYLREILGSLNDGVDDAKELANSAKNVAEGAVTRLNENAQWCNENATTLSGLAASITDSATKDCIDLIANLLKQIR